MDSKHRSSSRAVRGGDPLKSCNCFECNSTSVEIFVHHSFSLVCFCVCRICCVSFILHNLNVVVLLRQRSVNIAAVRILTHPRRSWPVNEKIIHVKNRYLSKQRQHCFAIPRLSTHFVCSISDMEWSPYDSSSRTKLWQSYLAAKKIWAWSSTIFRSCSYYFLTDLMFEAQRSTIHNAKTAYNLELECG